MAIRTTLNVSLPVELGHFIKEQVASGRYASASEVVRAGLRLLEERETSGAQGNKTQTSVTSPVS